MITPILATALFLISAIATRQLVANSHRLSTLDIPNERSSHQTPTPRGGGIAFVAASLVGFTFLLLNNTVGNAELLTLCCAGVIVATAGHLDDRQKISGTTIRLVLHAIGAIVLIVGIGTPSQISLFDRTVSTGFIGSILGVIYLMWLLNLFNFMDGTDGIAASEAIFVCVAGAILNYHTLSDIKFSAAAIVLATSTFGFLLYNWAPAKIFMGDVGSGYLGIVIGGLSLMAANQKPDLLWVWIILLAVFVCDATVTLICRLLRKQKPHIAHRSHAYQQLAIRFNSHAKISLIVITINMVWLFPIAYLVANSYVPVATGALVAYVPLVIAMFALRAGKDPKTK